MCERICSAAGTESIRLAGGEMPLGDFPSRLSDLCFGVFREFELILEKIVKAGAQFFEFHSGQAGKSGMNFFDCAHQGKNCIK